MRKKNKSKSKSELALDFRESIRNKSGWQVWCFFVPKKKGNKLFDSLVKVGRRVRIQNRHLADTTVGKVTEKQRVCFGYKKDKVEKIFDTSVNHSLK